jgi:hypothetical protein
VGAIRPAAFAVRFGAKKKAKFPRQVSNNNNRFAEIATQRFQAGDKSHEI